MTTAALDKRITFGMFVKNMGDKLKGIMARSISPEEKLNLILDEMSKDVQQKRITARDIRTKMVALADPDTAELEPLERLKVRREKLVKAGSAAMKENKTEEVKRLANEVKSLDTSLNSLEQTYDTLKDSYELSLENYKVAQAAYEHAKNNGQTLLFAIKAHQDALEMRDNAKSDGKKADVSFLNDLEGELEKSQRDLRSDKQIDKELNIEPQEMEDSSDNENIMKEFASK